jgi:hypothetical protein
MSALAELAPGGFTGAINSPTADVLNLGTVSATWTNSVPEKQRDFPGSGGFGSFNLGFGVLPGLEMVGRLAIDGDLQCNSYSENPPCQASMRDLSVSAKYQLPLRLDWNTRMAIGVVDVGGAATFFRSYYGVATSSFGKLDMTLGYGKGNHLYSTLNGVFGSTQFLLDDHWRALVEYDSREWRAGFRYARPLSEKWALELGASRKLSNSTDQQVWQASLGLNYSFEKRALNDSFRKPLAVVATKRTVGHVESQAASAPELANGQQSRAQQLSNRLRSAGFSSVWVGFDDAKSWVLQAEPLAWRKNRLDAMAVALATWQQSAQVDEHVRLTLSYLQNPVLTVQTTAKCLAIFAEGGWLCEGLPALTLENAQSVREPDLGWAVASASSAEALRPQLEIGPVLQQRIGTEYGLIDASLGLGLGWELALARGLLWQGVVTVPVAHTDDFDSNRVFGNDRIQRRLESSTVSLQRQLSPQLWAQASVGYVQHNDYGGQLDLAWLSPTGNWRLSGMGAYYRGDDTRGWTLESIRHPMALASARWSVMDGRWFLEVQGGQFYNRDRGIKLASHHWFGDYRLTFHYQSTESAAPFTLPRTQFAGFQLTMPIGPRESMALGPATVRGSDQWTYGVESKVRGGNNYITSGYGVVPDVRHGLLNDTLDADRAGLADIMANLYRVRPTLRERSGQP